MYQASRFGFFALFILVDLELVSLLQLPNAKLWNRILMHDWLSLIHLIPIRSTIRINWILNQALTSQLVFFSNSASLAIWISEGQKI